MENKLTVKEIEYAKPRAKEYKLYDGGALVVLVQPSGGKYFRFTYTRPNGKPNWISLGVFPRVTLAKARETRDEKRQLLSQGIDPSHDRKAKKLAKKIAAENDFKSIALEFFPTRKYPEKNLARELSRFVKHVFPHIGSLPISQITPLQILAVVQPIDESGKHSTAHRILAACGQVFRYGIATQRCASDPTRDLRGALTPCDPQNFAAITEPKQVGPMLRMIDGYEGTLVVRAALKLAPLFFVRPGELVKAKWADFNLDEAVWRFVLSKRIRGKQRRELIVPLCRQALEILRMLKTITGLSEYVFPSLRMGTKTISGCTINAALRAMGIPKEEMCGHGFRAMARTILAEVLHVPSEIIEFQLGHAVKDANGTAYNRTSFLPERREMMQGWADYLDGLKAEILQ
jgi:integrase